MTEEHIPNTRQHRGYTLVRTDPYGFWHIQGSDGETVLSESYTMVSMARAALDNILDRPRPVEATKKRKSPKEE